MAAPGLTTAGIRTGIGDFGAAAQSLFQGFAQEKLAEGYAMSADGYRKASVAAIHNAETVEKSTAIQLEQAERKIFKSLGGTSADVASSGFSESGSALDLLAESAQQGELEKNLLELQGELTARGYRTQSQTLSSQADMAMAQAAAASKASTGSKIGAGISAVAGIAAMFSDRRLKFNIRDSYVSRHYRWYTYRYLWSPWKLQHGVIAQEVQRVNPAAVRKHWTGFLIVDYGKL